MKVYFIGAGPGAPDLITLRGLRLLKKCRVCIYAGSLVSDRHLEEISEDTRVYDSSKLTLNEMCKIFREAWEQGENVARLHTGDPSLYGAIGEQMDFCERNKIATEVVPGVSSFSASAAAIKKELTLPGVTQTVILTRCGGRTPVPEKERIERLAEVNATMCIFLSAGLLKKTVDLLLKHYKEKTPAAVVYKATWPDQEVIISDLGSVCQTVEESKITKTAMILVGDFIQNNGLCSKLYDSKFSHGFREAE